MNTLLRMQEEELTTNVFDFIKSAFKGKKIAIHVYEEDEQEMDETDYLLSNAANKAHLLAGIEEADKKAELKTYTVRDLQSMLQEPEP